MVSVLTLITPRVTETHTITPQGFYGPPV
jgi:hypothetical protein